jgi:hypothetical protein
LQLKLQLEKLGELFSEKNPFGSQENLEKREVIFLKLKNESLLGRLSSGMILIIDFV